MKRKEQVTILLWAEKHTPNWIKNADRMGLSYFDALSALKELMEEKHEN